MTPPNLDDQETEQLMELLQQPRLYRVRLFQGYQEAFSDRRYPAVLDLTPGPAVLVAEAKLDALLQALAYDHGARGVAVRSYRLTVEPWPTGAVLYDWAARTWPDPT